MISLFKKNRTRKYLYFCLSPVYYLLGLLRGIGLIKKKYIIYGAAGGIAFIDNSKYSFLLNKNEYDCIWITHSYSLSKELRLKGYKAYLSYSLKGLFYQIFAEIAIISHGTFDLNPMLLFRVPVIQYWHGCPIKRIGSDIYMNGSKTVGDAIWDWIYKLIPHLNNYYADFFVDNSINMNYKSPFKPFISRYLQLPYPRLITLQSDKNEEIENNIKALDEFSSLKLKGKHIVVYLPTYRKDLNQQKKLANQLIELHKLFSEDDRFVFVYKSHFISPDIADLKNKNILEYTSPDPYPLLSISSALISDYSSVIFDYLLTKKPLSIFTYDMDFYKNDPGYYYDIEEIFTSYIARKPVEVYNMLCQQIINEDSKKDEQLNIFNNLFLPSYNNGNYDIEGIKKICGLKQ